MIQFYIAGPYTGRTTTEVFANVTKAMHAAYLVAQFRGWLPIIPHTAGIHATGQAGDPPWTEAMDQCMKTIRRLRPHRDRLVLLPDWAKSRGACEEVIEARALGIEVWTLAEALDPGILDVEIPNETMEEKCD